MQQNIPMAFRRPDVLFQEYIRKFPSLALRWVEKNGERDKRTWASRNIDSFYKMGAAKGFDCW